MKALITTSVLLSAVALIGCNPNAVLETRKAPAPKKEAETGFIVKAQSEQQVIDLLNTNPQAQYRLINKNHQLYEIFNLKGSELNNHHLQVMTRNKMIKLQPNHLNIDLLVGDICEDISHGEKSN